LNEVENAELGRTIEAILLVAVEPIAPQLLAELVEEPVERVEEVLSELARSYEGERRGFVLARIAGGVRFQTHPDLAPYVERFANREVSHRLSTAALETLAIVAYLQPVTKGDIEGIRGVSADSVLSTLVDRRFLTEAGRKDVAGRPILYRTTPEFLEAFGLRSLEELPPVDIDSAAPVELALPIQTQAVPAEGEPNIHLNPASDSVSGPAASEPEPAETSAAGNESENVSIP
jgi:segregation and condensation protein B